MSDDQGKLTNIARYKNGHLLDMYREMTPLKKQIAAELAGMDDSDFKTFESFAERCRLMGEHSAKHNCKLFIDAE